MEDKQAICSNPWCKATFYYNSDIKPEQCSKCKSFDSELSGGVTWSEKKYEGDRFDGMPHLTKINIKPYSK